MSPEDLVLLCLLQICICIGGFHGPGVHPESVLECLHRSPACLPAISSYAGEQFGELYYFSDHTAVTWGRRWAGSERCPGGLYFQPGLVAVSFLSAQNVAKYVLE